MLAWKKQYLKFVAISSLNMALYVSYRLYRHKMQTKIDKLNAINEELMKKLNLDLQPVMIKSFANKDDLLKTFNFIETEDDLAKLSISLFNYKGYVFALRKYASQVSPEYTLLAETSKIARDGYSSEKLCNEFLAKIKISKLPVVWKNEYHQQFEKKLLS